MKDPIKITQEELQETLDLQKKFQDLVFEFGKLYVEKIQVEGVIKDITEREVKIQEEWKNLQAKENDAVQLFYKKYGEGSLDLKNALFVPTSE